MANPYLDPDDGDDETPLPQPTRPALPIAWIALAVAVAGCFLPSTDGCSIPAPVPPYVEPVVDPAETEGSWVVVVEETSARTPVIAKVLNDPMWQGMETRGLKYRHYDVDADESRVYQDVLLELGGVPIFIVMTPDGKVLAKGKLPASADELDAKIKEATAR